MDNDVIITAKQKEFLKSKLHRINLLEGSVRSGKTWISIVMFAMYVASRPRSDEFLMIGKTLTTLNRNCLGLLKNLEPAFNYSLSAKRGSLYGRTIWLEGADNVSAENKIRGMTLAGAYVDEITLLPYNFYNMLLSRISMPKAKLFATTNPDSPNHWVYTDIIQNDEIDKKVTRFLLEDNTTLDPEYIENLKKEYTGVYYQRYILGEWVLAEGLVYPNYDNTVPTISRNYAEYYVSMDYGIQNPTAMLLWGRYQQKWYCIREFYHSGRDTKDQKTDEQYYNDLERLCNDIQPQYIYIDPSASSFITLVRQRGKYTVLKAHNEVIEGIQHVASALSNGYIYFNDCCKMTIREFGLYSWDDRAVEDTVVKENDHCMDAVRYFVQTKRIYKNNDDYGNYKGMF